MTPDRAKLLFSFLRDTARERIFLKLHIAHAIITPWKQNGSLETELRKSVEQNLTSEEILGYVKREYIIYKCSKRTLV